jgi:hypothetical protein
MALTGIGIPDVPKPTKIMLTVKAVGGAVCVKASVDGQMFYEESMTPDDALQSATDLIRAASRASTQRGAVKTIGQAAAEVVARIKAGKGVG